VNVGIGYLSIDRAGPRRLVGRRRRSGSAWATQIRLVAVGRAVTLDPSIGLHRCDTSKLIVTLSACGPSGNTVIVFEHDGKTLRSADHLATSSTSAVGP